MVIPVGDVDGAAGGDRHPERVVELGGVAAVSYTHLTLPTSDLV